MHLHRGLGRWISRCLFTWILLQYSFNIYFIEVRWNWLSFWPPVQVVELMTCLHLWHNHRPLSNFLYWVAPLYGCSPLPFPSLPPSAFLLHLIYIPLSCSGKMHFIILNSLNLLTWIIYNSVCFILFFKQHSIFSVSSGVVYVHFIHYFQLLHYSLHRSYLLPQKGDPDCLQITPTT